MRIWGIHKKYPALSWWMNFMGGHISAGPVTIFGANAMNWVVNIRTKRWGSICFTLPVLARWKPDRYTGKKRFDWYFYVSPNGTPWACTFYRGSDKAEKIRAQIRLLNFGHGFDSWGRGEELYALNQKFGSFTICEFDVERYARREELA